MTESELQGFDEMIAYFRKVREERSSATQYYRLTYYRNGGKIGDELYVGFYLIDRLTYFADEGYRGDPAYLKDYAPLAKDFGVSVQRIQQVVTFEMLEKRKPSKTKQVTTGSSVPSHG